MKNILLLILAVSMLIFEFLLGCNTASNAKESEYQAKIDELEKQIEALEKQITETRSQTQTLNKDVAEVLVLGSSPEVKEKQTLNFSLAAGDIAEGEVSTTYGSGKFISSVKDPFGNIIMQSKTYTQSFTGTSLGIGTYQITRQYSSQVYPWRFSFIASTKGEYTLEVTKDVYEGTGLIISNAHLRVIINP